MPDTDDDVDPAHRRYEALLAEVYVALQRYLVRRADAGTAEDVLSDTLLVIWRRLDDVPADAALPWCYAVARRCLANALRSSRRRTSLVERLVAQPAPGDPADDRRLEEALLRLPERERELLRLWAWEELAPREIAVVLQITPNAASIRLHRAIGRLRTEMGVADGKSPAGSGHLPQRTPRKDP